MLYIGVGLGTSAIKLLSMDGSRRIHKVVSQEYPLCFPHSIWSGQSPKDWFMTSMDGMKELAPECDKSQVAGISFGGQMHDLVTLDQADEVIRPAILWNNGRSEKETDYLNQTIGKEKLSAYTANIAFAGFTTPKILRMKRNEPENFARICRIMLPRDYLAYRLSDSLCTDCSDAPSMLFLDVAHKCWSEEMMELYGITRKQLPDLYESYKAVGNLKEEPAKGLGFSQDVKIIAGTGSNAVAAAGTETVGEGRYNISLGTSGTTLISSKNSKVDCNSVLHSFDHTGRRFHFMGYMFSAASRNEQWMEEILKTKEFSREREGTVKLGEDHVFYPPCLMGECSPHNDPRARACSVGMTMGTSRKEMTQVVLESVVYGLRDSPEMVRGLGIYVNRIKICGGGTEGPLRKRVVANIMNVKVSTVGSEEDSVLGGTILTAVGCKGYPDVKTAADSIAKVTGIIEPGGELAEKYEKQYSKFRQMYPVLKTVFQNLGEQYELGVGRSRLRCIMIRCTGTLETRPPFSQPERAFRPPCVPGSYPLLIREAAVSCLPEEEEKMRMRGFLVRNVKEPALTAWDVLIFIIWTNHTLREQER